MQIDPSPKYEEKPLFPKRRIIEVILLVRISRPGEALVWTSVGSSLYLNANLLQVQKIDSKGHARNVETVTKVTPVLARFLQNEVVQSVTTCHPCSGELIGGIEHGLAP